MCDARMAAIGASGTLEIALMQCAYCGCDIDTTGIVFHSIYLGHGYFSYTVYDYFFLVNSLECPLCGNVIQVYANECKTGAEFCLN